MSKANILQLLFFAGVMVPLTYFFDLNISILGSLALTIALYLMINTLQPGYG